MKDRPIARPRWMESVEASKGPRKRDGHRWPVPGPTGPRRRTAKKRNKWVRWVTARRKSWANGRLNAKPARTHTRPIPPSLSSHEPPPRNLIIKLMGSRWLIIVTRTLPDWIGHDELIRGGHDRVWSTYTRFIAAVFTRDIGISWWTCCLVRFNWWFRYFGYRLLVEYLSWANGG